MYGYKRDKYLLVGDFALNSGATDDFGYSYTFFEQHHRLLFGSTPNQLALYQAAISGRSIHDCPIPRSGCPVQLFGIAGVHFSVDGVCTLRWSNDQWSILLPVCVSNSK